MNYIIKGNLRGLLCSDCELPVAGTSVKVYKPADQQNETRLAVADPKQTFHQVTDDELKSKERLFITQADVQENGDFSIEIDGAKTGYEGGSIDVDWYCGNEPFKIPLPKKGPVLQFHITTLQPLYKSTRENAQYARFDYRIDSKWFCRILTLLDIWVVCGYVTDCKTKTPIAGVRVFAYDVDLLQDDVLGNAYTDGSGKFTIVYPGDNFRKTLLPWLNVEWPAGPDYYFRIESSSGNVLLAEDRTRGRQNDRHNANNCFCVKLCIDGSVIVENKPWFTSFGYFNIISDIDGLGKTSHAKYGAGGVGYGFFGSVKLEGYAPKKVPTAPSSPLYYRFLYSLDNVTFNPLTLGHMPAVGLKVATRKITWNGMDAFQDVVIDGTLPASLPDTLPPDNFPADIVPHVLHPDPDGWVRVDQVAIDTAFNGPLFYVNTAAIISGGDASVGLTPGVPVSAADQKNGKLLYVKFQTTDDPANPGSPNLNTQVQIGKIHVNNWNQVSLIKLEELFAGGTSGCTPVNTSAHADYTADHELLNTWRLEVWSAATGSVTGLPNGNLPRGNADKYDMAVAAGITPLFTNWPSCAYSLTLVTQRKLTTGEENDPEYPKQVIFCK